MTIILKYFHILTENIEYIGFMVLLFLAVVFFVGGLIFLLQRRNFMADRLSSVLPSRNPFRSKKTPQLVQEGPQGFFEKVSSKIHPIIAPTELSTKKRLQLMMIQAGFRSEQAYHNFLAAKLIFAFLFPCAYLLKTAFYKFSPQSLAIALIAAIVGYYVPNFFIQHQRDKRKEK